MSDIVAKVIQNNNIKTRFGEQNQPQVVQTILNDIPTSIYFKNLADVDSTGLKNGSVPVYNSVLGKFKLIETKDDITDGGNF